MLTNLATLPRALQSSNFNLKFFPFFNVTLEPNFNVGIYFNLVEVGIIKSLTVE